MATLEITLTVEETRLLGVPQRKIADDYRFVPLTIVGSDGKVTAPDLEKHLESGQKLSIVAAGLGADFETGSGRGECVK